MEAESLEVVDLLTRQVTAAMSRSKPPKGQRGQRDDAEEVSQPGGQSLMFGHACVFACFSCNQADVSLVGRLAGGRP
jgi:hypothetical protein